MSLREMMARKRAVYSTYAKRAQLARSAHNLGKADTTSQSDTTCALRTKLNKMKLSIITINYNNAEGLRKTLASVAAQTFRDFEHIIVDGGSTDESVEIIHQYTDENPHTPSTCVVRWIGEPDKGIYSAMNKGIEIALGKRVVNSFNRSELVEDKNKGIKMASGEYLLFLNSGDYLVDECVIENVLPLLDGMDIIQGNTVSVINNKKFINRGYAKSDISFIDVYNGHFLHQATFAKRCLFDLYGYFDESYKIGGDTVFFFKALGFGNASFAYRDINIAYYDVTGISANHTPYWNKQRTLEDQMYDELLSNRLLRLCKEDGYKINIYNQISSHCFLKKCMMLLLKISNILDKNAK